MRISCLEDRRARVFIMPCAKLPEIRIRYAILLYEQMCFICATTSRIYFIPPSDLRYKKIRNCITVRAPRESVCTPLQSTRFHLELYFKVSVAFEATRCRYNIIYFT
jgi:hypothetical protein